MKILVVGSGGREHSLVWKLKKSRYLKEIFSAPGNGGISQDATCLDIKATDLESLIKFSYDERVDLVIVGPEAPLVSGIVDLFEKEKIKIFGPRREAALLEGSKVFAKEMMKRWGVPTAEFKIFHDYAQAWEFVKEAKHPLVIKADGLCQGKGAMVSKEISESQEVLKKIMIDKVFGEAGDKVVIEDYLEGEEASILVISDGRDFVSFAPSQDHKQVFDGDRGPNTGGMGAYSPAPLIDERLLKDIEERVIRRTIEGMYKDVIPFQGILYAGLMITSEGPFVLEFNVRFGDPETQAILPRLKSDLLEIIMRAVDSKLQGFNMDWDERISICVVLASGGYPGSYEKGLEIKGLQNFKERENIIIFHAATILKDGVFYTNGGRVLNVCCLGKDFLDSYQNVYRACAQIGFRNMYYRRDIGLKALKRLGLG